MRAARSIGASLLALASTTCAAVVPSIQERDTACTNGPNTRSCWTDGYSSSTNWYQKFPDTGKTVSYTLEATDVIMAPDGVQRAMQVFNGQYPGPTITADWGDTIVITIKNSLKENGTSIHWHGLRQLNSNQMDGVNGLTECPIAPGDSRTYTFKATEYGTSWYHSHYSVQYADGLVGTIVINGPTTSNYDLDLGTLALTDWYHTPVFEILASRPQAPPTAQNLLVNGLGVYQGNGQYSQFVLTPGKKHKLRIINTGINQYLHVSLDGHPFTVVAADFVSVKPFVVTSLALTVGQRYDVIIEANQTVSSYWFRVQTGGGLCDGPNEKTDTQGAVFSYTGAASGTPSSTPYSLGTGCTEELNWTPFVPVNAVAPATAPTELDLSLDTSNGPVWKVNGVAIHIDWQKPSLAYVQDGVYTLPASDNGITIAGANEWVYWLIQNNTPLPHPFHLHGHDFVIVATGSGSGVGVGLNTNNPLRRDTHSVDAGGYAVIAFQSDNPGAWLLHCHIPFHISGGLGVQFLERPTEIIASIGSLSDMNDSCDSWTNYQDSVGLVQPDSGL